MSRQPNFLVIGAQKAGTTWIAQNLIQHPQVFMPAREVRFFNDNYDKGIEWYRSWFAEAGAARAVGEKTPGYLWVPSPFQQDFPPTKRRDVPELVYRFDPEMKLIVSLRDPVHRAISAFYHHMRAGRIALHERILDVGQRYGIIDRGFYYFQLDAWLRHFPRRQFHILIFERDIVGRPQETLEELFRFLEVDEGFRPHHPRHRFNRHWGPFVLYLNTFSRPLARLAAQIPLLNRLPYPDIRVTPAEIAQLARLYEPDIRRLERLLEQDLSLWTRPG
ncbi:MAG: hypothetical protein D6775_03555 [Caldilineae bacterium]|nr:MAG: hypothetical protein D6775_03555 [Caldilineae bacterium]